MADYTDYLASLYETYLGRAPDAEGLAYWQNQLNSGANTNDVYKAISQSPEATVYNTYQTQLGRAPDAEGLAYWTNDIASGNYTAADVAKAIGASYEGAKYDVNNYYNSELSRNPDPQSSYWLNKLMSGSMTEQEFQTALRYSPEYVKLALDQYGDILNKTYQDELGRDPDQAGLEYWARQLRSGAMKEGDLSAAFSYAPEGFINDIYMQNLGRRPDAEGLKYWMDAIESGRMTREEVANAIKKSEEGVSNNPANIGKPNTTYNSPYGPVSVFSNYSKMRSLPDAKSQPFGFLYDTINERLGYDASKRGLLDDVSLFNAPGVAAYNPVSTFTAGGTPNMVGSQTGLLSGNSLVTQAYQDLFGREPDPSGLTAWTNNVNAGMTRDQLYNALRSSPEYQQQIYSAQNSTNNGGGTTGGGN